MSNIEVRAAGGIIWREHRDIEVVVIHRPRYDDWSFPKGKCEPGESDEECALREVAEETGLKCTMGSELASIQYEDRHGRLKQVRYWAMEPIGASSDWDDEVDVLCWLRRDAVTARLSYARDVAVFDSFCALANAAQ